MNWYKFAKEQTIEKVTPIIGLEEKILRADAEQIIRRRLFSKGKYAPDESTIKAYVNRVMGRIKDQYNSYNQIRQHVSGECLSPAVDEIVSTIIK